MSLQESNQSVRLSCENIGGIDKSEVYFEPGVTILAGRNATNRTSLLQAIMAALGSNNVSLKTDSDEGSVEMEIGSEQYSRELQRRDGSIEFKGDPYLADATTADLFAFLLESNEARRAVATSGELREIIMAPVDTANIESEIKRFSQEKREIKEELEDLKELKSELPSLEKRRTELKSEIDDVKEQLHSVEEKIDQRDADVERKKEKKEELEKKLEALQKKREQMDDIRYKIETEKESLESLKREQKEVAAEIEEMPDESEVSRSEIESKISRLRTQRNNIESEISEIQDIIQFNQKMLQNDAENVVASVQQGDAEGSVTDELLADETVTCWTCGSDVDVTQIEETVAKLQELSKSRVSEANDIEERLDEAKQDLQRIDETTQRREELQRRREKLQDEIAKSEKQRETLEERKRAVKEEIETIEEEVDDLEDESYSEILELHKEANELEYELGGLETDLQNVEDEIERIEEQLGEEKALKNRKNELTQEIEALRTRVETLEKKAIEKFNEQMDTVLGLLDYDNIARVWIERREVSVRDGRQKKTKTIFDLHIVRQSENGTTYEDQIENLSQSEREVTGLIFALSGYLAHQLYERVPFILLDSLEAIDSERIANLVEYFEEFSDFLVVALLPEDAAKLSSEYSTISDF